jgi:hypothetical protein
MGRGSRLRAIGLERLVVLGFQGTHLGTGWMNELAE